MNSSSSRAEETAAFLLRSEWTDSPVMIPGAFERRANASAGSGGHGTNIQVKDHSYAVTVSDRERLVYEREGGGAPSERSGRHRASILQKLWRRMRRRPEVPSPLFVSLPKQHEYATAQFKADTAEHNDGNASVKYPAGETYTFGFRAVQDKAPTAAGRYAVFTSRRWLYVGESNDIRQSLFQCLNNPGAYWKAEHRPLSFAFETAPTVPAAT